MKIKAALFGIMLAIGLLAAASPVLVRAQSNPEIQKCIDFRKQFDLTGDAKDNPFAWVNPAHYCTVQGFLYWLLQIAFMLAGVVAVLFVVLGGYQYLTSAGNEEQAEKGRKTLTNAIAGLVIIIMAFALVRIVINTLKGDLTGSGTTNTNTQQQQQTNTPKTEAEAGTAVFNGANQADIGKNYAFSITIPKTLTAFYCQGAKASAVAYAKKADGSLYQFPSSTLVPDESGQNYVTNFNISPTSLGFIDQGGATSGKSLQFGLRVCGQELPYSWSVPLVSSTSFSLDSDVEAAALGSSFIATLTDGGKTIHVDIHSQTSDRVKLCGVSQPSYLGQKTLEVFVDGQSAGTAVADQDSVDIFYTKPITSAKTVTIKICGRQIGLESQIVAP